MTASRVTAWILLGISAFFLLLALSAFLVPGGNMKGMGAFLFAFFFLAMAGWLIGDF